ncbi:tRNA uridine-5-carboxymethylaminomethyl(34) synthesis GTPase MnmE [Pelagibacterium xiamenense]|uniref:tRNA uridine-5-carboxymethylaminomethyl(34) synthesis GTPase MnmE n=1 Tax=Pelagibacterium xiamenense TaxID=2901140 RepID=UPI001E5850CD|nr:tRNA uridine-5-carboxymethylaminomethyl(34) synthesis GTPase MnmE [Pelagibacterium xiamenense]MCD7058424.1 tRNA uridine-5-carboxymethylaminomethyl(34) synthesis GTPase MnmE [Pelagibacterium xiamenense]
MAQPTIVALSSGSLPSGVAVVRLSGPKALAAVETLCGALPEPRKLALRTLRDPGAGEPLDQGLIAIFPAPRSFTGEDCAELHVHGSPAGVKAILGALTAMEGVVLAGPGDFTRRAFENGKFDLTAIEGLGDLLAAETESQRKQALMRLGGGLAVKITRWRDILIDARAEIEAHLDFADEDDVPQDLPQDFGPGLATLARDIESALSGYASGRIVREGFRIVLAGPPNAGKSSLLNALAGSDLAIVTDEAGTTRDTKDVAIDLGGQLVIVTDTAGLRETTSKAEAAGIERTGQALDLADLVLWLDAPDIAEASLPETRSPVWRLATKADLQPPKSGDLAVSARTGAGVEALISRLKTHIEARLGGAETGLVSHLRDRQALEAALGHIHRGITLIDQPELCAEELRLTSDALARLIGLIDTETVLDRLFAGFCIGK